MTELREAGKNRSDKAYRAQVRKAYEQREDRELYSLALLNEIRRDFPSLKVGVFTRSPKSYAETVLELAFPGFEWDVVVSYEDVKRTKPFGDGIDKAMFGLGLKYISRIVLVGDGNVDIRSAYHAGCVVVLDRTSWSRWLVRDNWRSLEHMPDVIIDKPSDLLRVIEDYRCFLPDLERRLYGVQGSGRYDRVNKFLPKEVGGDSKPVAIFSCGRSFSNYKSLEWRRKWHKLSESIQEHKDSENFADEWIESVRGFISAHFRPMLFSSNLMVTVVPHRPGRTPRLEAFLDQLSRSYEDAPLPKKSSVVFYGDVLAFKDSVKSNHGDFLGRIERFTNIQENLYVKRGELLKQRRRILVIDDVSTTGASLIYAKKYLEEAGAFDVTCLSIAMNISDVLYG